MLPLLKATSTKFIIQSPEHSRNHSGCRMLHHLSYPSMTACLCLVSFFNIAIKKTMSSSSPCPHDQVPYLVFKRCPSLATALLDLFNTCWRLQSVPSPWKMGVIRLIPKSAASQDPHLPSNFRPIALTSCVGKLFTSLLKSRWLQFMVANNFLDSSVQKAFLPGIPGCFEQYQKLLLMIADAHKKHRSLTVCAYGTPPTHHLLPSALPCAFHLPQHRE